MVGPANSGGTSGGVPIPPLPGQLPFPPGMDPNQWGWNRARAGGMRPPPGGFLPGPRRGPYMRPGFFPGPRGLQGPPQQQAFYNQVCVNHSHFFSGIGPHNMFNGSCTRLTTLGLRLCASLPFRGSLDRIGCPGWLAYRISLPTQLIPTLLTFPHPEIGQHRLLLRLISKLKMILIR